VSFGQFLFVHADIDDADLSPSEFRVLAHYSRRAGRDGMAYSSISSVAKKCGICQRTVKVVNRVLVEKGWLRRVSRPGRTTAYVPQLPPGAKCTPGKNAPRVSDVIDPGQITTRGPVQNASHEVTPLKSIPENNPLSPAGGDDESFLAWAKGEGIQRKHAETITALWKDGKVASRKAFAKTCKRNGEFPEGKPDCRNKRAVPPLIQRLRFEVMCREPQFRAWMLAEYGEGFEASPTKAKDSIIEEFCKAAGIDPDETLHGRTLTAEAKP